MANWFVSPTGLSGNTGAIGSPWSLASVVSGHSGAIQPGDTVWLRGGTYAYADAGENFTLAGLVGSGVDNEDGKIIFRAYNPTVVNIPRNQWLSSGEATWLGTGDPTQTEHVIIQQTCTPKAATAGAVTVSGAQLQNATTLTVAKAAGVNQPIAVGEQLSIATGAAAGLYVIQAANTIVQNTTTVLSILPGLRGATAGGEAVTLTLSPAVVADLFTIDNNANFLWFWDLHLKQIHSLRTIDFTGAGFSTFNKVAPGNDGLKVLNTSFEGFAGSPCFIERTCGRTELNGNLVWNTGHAPPGTTDGGGHGNYVHHDDDGVKELLLEAQCFFNDHGIAIQIYDSSNPTQPIGRVRVKNNISMNSGQLNTAPNIGRFDATTWVLGGGQGGSCIFQNIIAEGNIALQTDGNGDRAFDARPQGSARIGANFQVVGNYSRVSGSGFGAGYFGSVVAGTGAITHLSNTYRAYRADAGPPQHNGLCTQLQELGAVDKPGQYTWGGNTYYRNLGLGGGSCGDENPGGAPFAFMSPGASCANRTLANFNTRCGFPTAGQTTDVRTADPGTTQTFVRKRRWAAGSAWVAYDNYAGLSQIPVDLSSFLGIGDTYVIHDVRDIYGAAIAGPSVYLGGTVNFPNTQLSDPAQSGAQPGLSLEAAAPATAPTFNAFLVRRTIQGVRRNNRLCGVNEATNATIFV